MTSSSAAVGWIAIVAFVLIGSRELLTGGVPAIGQFLTFGDSPRRLFDQFLSGWDPQGLGHTGASPTGLALVALGSTATLFRTGLFHTVAIVGLLVVGPLGMWRLSGAFSTTRARLGAAVVYAAVPLPGQLLSVGRWGALLVYAALPWSIDAMRSFAGSAFSAATRSVPVSMRSAALRRSRGAVFATRWIVAAWRARSPPP